MKKYIANLITGCRILLSIVMMFFSVFSYRFYVTYFLCGISDMIDGIIARKTNNSNGFGAKLDTIADFIFFSVSLIKLLPILYISIWLWIWVLVIAIIKTNNIIFGLVSNKRLIFMYTSMNKITGLILFLLPLTIHLIDLKYSSIVVCLIATFLAIQECVVIRTEK